MIRYQEWALMWRQTFMSILKVMILVLFQLCTAFCGTLKLTAALWERWTGLQPRASMMTCKPLTHLLQTHTILAQHPSHAPSLSFFLQLPLPQQQWLEDKKGRVWCQQAPPAGVQQQYSSKQKFTYSHSHLILQKWSLHLLIFTFEHLGPYSLESYFNSPCFHYISYTKLNCFHMVITDKLRCWKQTAVLKEKDHHFLNKPHL